MPGRRFSWIAHDDNSCLTVNYQYPPEDSEDAGTVAFKHDHGTLQFTREEWAELMEIVEECFEANEEIS